MKTILIYNYIFDFLSQDHMYLPFIAQLDRMTQHCLTIESGIDRYRYQQSSAYKEKNVKSTMLLVLTYEDRSSDT